MPVLKKDRTASLVRDAVVLDLGDLRKQGEAIVESARLEAVRVLEEARAEAQRLTDEAAAIGRAQGLEEGRREGLDQGRCAGREETLADLAPRIEALVASWGDAVDAWSQQRGEMLLEAREDVLRLALAVARKVTHRVVDVDPSRVCEQVAEALALTQRPSSAIVLVHPDDHGLVEETLPWITAKLDAATSIELRVDDEVDRGGCIVRTAGGSIDAGIDVQLDRIAETLVPQSSTT